MANKCNSAAQKHIRYIYRRKILGLSNDISCPCKDQLIYKIGTSSTESYQIVLSIFDISTGPSGLFKGFVIPFVNKYRGIVQINKLSGYYEHS